MSNETLIGSVNKGNEAFFIADYLKKNNKSSLLYIARDEKEIFEGKTFQDLTKDIYENTTKRKTQIDLLISEIHGFITTIDDVVMVAPIIKEYMDTAVRNDEHLVKLAGVLQRIISKSQGDSDESMLLSDSEKEELMSTLQDTVDDLNNEQVRLEGIKNKTINPKISES